MQFYIVTAAMLVCVVRGQINIREVNDLVLTDLVNSTSGIGSHKSSLKSLIDVVTKNDRIHPHDGVLNDFITSCGTPLNKTACRDVLNILCADIPVLLRHLVDKSSGVITVTDLFPLLIYHESSLTCGHHTEERKHGRTVPTIAQAWGYGIGFVALICLIANVGAFMGPFMSKRYFEKILLFVVALAVGTLAGTGMLVLIPESMHLTEEDSPIPDYHLKMTTVLCGVYFFYVAERIMKMCFVRRKHKQTTTDDQMDRGTELTGACEAEQLNNTEVENHDGRSHTFDHVKNGVNGIDGDVRNTKVNEVSTVAWMVLTGDVLHNFVDGIAIGAAFTENLYLGVSVSIAIICEELPHELGDIAILLNAGLSMKRALIYNFLAAIVCFLGLALGIVVGENSDANVWIFAIAGGMFVYIALVDMLPEMAIQYDRVVNDGIESPGMAFFIQNVGLIIGFLIIFFLAFYGGNIQV